MKTYELMTIAKLSLGEDKARTLSNEVKDLITGLKGKVLDSNFWGKRKFAYPIKNDTEGFYDVLKFELSPSDMPAFKAKLQRMDNLVRYLVTTA